MTRISIAGLDRAAALAALYNAARPTGMGFLQYDKTPMTRDEAAAILRQTVYFDYLKGRPLKISLDTDSIDPEDYDRKQGQGAAARAIEILRTTGDPNAEEIRRMHALGTAHAAEQTEAQLGTQTTSGRDAEGNFIHLGLGDVAEHLRPAIEKARRR